MTGLKIFDILAQVKQNEEALAHMLCMCAAFTSDEIKNRRKREQGRMVDA